MEIPSSPEEEKPKRDLFLLLRPAKESEDSQCLRDTAAVFKSNLVAHFKSSALSTSDMKILASECYNMLDKLGDTYTSFRTEVNKLIARHQKVETAAKHKEKWNESERKSRYADEVKSLCNVRQKLSVAQEIMSGAKTGVELLVLKKRELTDMLHTYTMKLYHEEQRLKSLTQERDHFQETMSEIQFKLNKLDEEKNMASKAFEDYNAAMGEFEEMSDALLNLLRKK